jgi:hypothetical protein
MASRRTPQPGVLSAFRCAGVVLNGARQAPGDQNQSTSVLRSKGHAVSVSYAVTLPFRGKVFWTRVGVRRPGPLIALARRLLGVVAAVWIIWSNSFNVVFRRINMDTPAFLNMPTGVKAPDNVSAKILTLRFASFACRMVASVCGYLSGISRSRTSG